MAAGNEPAIDGLSGLQLIGRGGFSTVYRARQERLARDVAVKVLRVDISDPRARDQFHSECAAAGRIGNHPNIVTVYDSGVTAQGQPYLVMEYCDQGTLADRLRNGVLDVPTALTILVKLNGALAVAHAAGILHRDIKPENVLFTSYGEPALADFGVAALTSGAQKSFTVAALTPNHAAPEVLDGARASAVSDVYSLASTAYQSLTGKPPFQRGGDEGLLSFFRRVVQDPAPPLARADAPPGLAEALARGLAKTPEQRYASAEEFGDVLRQVQQRAGFADTDLSVRRTAGPTTTATATATASPSAAEAPAAPAAPAAVPAGAQPSDVVIPPPPPPGRQPVPLDGNVTVLRPGGRPAGPAPAPAAEPERNRRSRLVPLVVATAVLALLLCGGGGYFGYQQFVAGPTGGQRQASGNGNPQGQVLDPGSTSSATPTTASTASASPSQTRTAGPPPAPTSNRPRSSAPTGPYVEYLVVKQEPSCPSSGPGTSYPGNPVTLEWKVAGGATGSIVSIDGPGKFGDYGVTETQQFPFSCGSERGKYSHTYTVTTVGGGPAASKTITVTANVN